MKTNSGRKSGGSSGVNTRPNYYSSNCREETLGCSGSGVTHRDGEVAHCGAVASCWSQACWTYLIYRNFKSQNGTDRWTCSRADPWPQEVLSEGSRSKPISSLALTAASESILLKVKGRPRKNGWEQQLVLHSPGMWNYLHLLTNCRLLLGIMFCTH